MGDRAERGKDKTPGENGPVAQAGRAFLSRRLVFGGRPRPLFRLGGFEPSTIAAWSMRRAVVAVLAIAMLAGMTCVGQAKAGTAQPGAVTNQTATTQKAAAQAAVAEAATPGASAAGANPAVAMGASNAGARVVLDRVVAIVNGNLILESDVDAERRMEALQPAGSRTKATHDELVERLIDRDLILQQMALQPQPPIAEAKVDEQLTELRKSIPASAGCDCKTEAGWEKFVAAQGFTMQQLKDRWRQRMEVLQFVEARFRRGILITQADTDAYYHGTLLPEYAAEKAPAPPEATVADRIQEILLEQDVNKLLDSWLTSLRSQGSVRILKPGEDAP